MRWRKLIAATLFLSGCTIVVEDRRLTREEVVAAFGQRDQAIEVLTTAVNALMPKEKKEAAPAK